MTTAPPLLLADRYRLGQLLGRGGMSDVHRAVDERTGVAVAVKLVRSGDAELARRLAQEVQLLEGFTHPGLVRLLDTGVAGDQAYLVMELVEGPTLAQRLRAGPLTPAATAELGATLADALAYVHASGIVHRDIKPPNVLLTPEGRPKLADFGIARVVDASSLTLAGTTLGTAAYMAPEQLQYHQVGPAADVWSLGIVLLECLTGRRVYEGAAAEVVARRLASPRPLPADLPAPWRLVLSGMLEHRPEARLAAADVASMLPAPALQAPWVRTQPAPEILSAVVGAGVVGGATEWRDLTGIHAPGSSDDHTVLAPPTAVAPPRAPAVRRRRRVGPRLAVAWSSGRRRLAERVGPVLARRDQRPWLLGTAVVVVLALVLALVLGNGASGPAGRPGAASPPVHTQASTGSGPSALGRLEEDVAAEEAAGGVTTAAGRAVAAAAARAVAAQRAGHDARATADLATAGTALVDGLRAGSVTQPAATKLGLDLAGLAGALGVAAPSVTTTTTTSTTTTTTTTTTAPPATTTTTAPPPGHDGGGGPGHGGDGGPGPGNGGPPGH
jgi:hypothetical protein